MPRYDDRGAIRKTSYSLFWKIPHSQASPNTIPTSTAMPAQVPGSRRSRAVDVIVSLIVLYTIGSCGVRIWRRNQSYTTAVIPRYATDPQQTLAHVFHGIRYSVTASPTTPAMAAARYSPTQIPVYQE